MDKKLTAPYAIPSMNERYRRWRSYAVLALMLGFIILTRIIWPATNIDLLGDQARDLEIGRAVASGAALEYGVPTTGEFLLFPHYYYVMGLAARVSPAPLVSIYVHAASNILAIGVFFLFAYRFLRERLGMAIVATSLIVFSYAHVWISNSIWNPNLLPLPLWSFLLLWAELLSPDLSRFRTGLYALAAGAIMGFCAGLHATALFAMPVISWLLLFGVSRWRRQLLVTGMGLAGYVLTTATYWHTEWRNDFRNTRAIADFLSGSGDNYLDFTWLQRLEFFGHNYIAGLFNIVNNYYLPKTYSGYIFLFSALSLLGLTYFRAARRYQQVAVVTLGVYLLVHAGLTGLDYLHFMVVGSFVPALGITNLLGLRLDTLARKAMVGVSLGLVAFGLVSNIRLLDIYHTWKYDVEERSLNETDYTQLLTVVDAQDITTLCVHPEFRRLREILRYYHRLEAYAAPLRVVTECGDAQYSGGIISLKHSVRWLTPQVTRETTRIYETPLLHLDVTL